MFAHADAMRAHTNVTFNLRNVRRRFTGGVTLAQTNACLDMPPPPLLPEAARHIDEEAIVAEAWGDIVALAADAQRQHVHYTHIRTRNANNRQPDSFTRSEFWDHMVQVYKDVYPEPANSTGSILLFGAVAKERHAAAADDGDALRAVHHHCPTYCSKRHYWRRVAKRSYEHYGVKLHAAAHEGYTAMWTYLSCPSPRKPASELDAEIFMSPDHPRGDVLRRLLEAGAAHQRAFRGRQGADGSQRMKRERVPDIFDLVHNKGLRTVDAVQAHAHEEAAAGRPALASLCTKQGHKLPLWLKNAAAMHGAAGRAQRAAMTLQQKLEHAAHNIHCCCGGVWGMGAVTILSNNSIDPESFCMAVRRACALGALRGANVACVGVGGCGKSTLLEPLEDIFHCMPKPQQGSTFPFADLAEYDVLLWQDYSHHEDTLRFTDLLSMFVGESFGVRVPGARNEKVGNKAPIFYSGRAAMTATRGSPGAQAELNRMMAERFTTFAFVEPLPPSSRKADWPKCGRCAAAFYLRGPSSASSASSSGGPLASAMVPPRAEDSVLLTHLNDLAKLREAGHLSEEEFTVAKARLLGLPRAG